MSETALLLVELVLAIAGAFVAGMLAARLARWLADRLLGPPR